MSNEQKILNSKLKEIFLDNKDKATICQAIIRIDENIQKLRISKNESLTFGQLDNLVNIMMDDVLELLEVKNYKKI